MFTIALFFIVPLFLYCTYLFAKDIKESYSMYSFKRNRLKAGNNSKEWKPVPFHEFVAVDNSYTKETILPGISTTQPATDTRELQEVEKPVIKLYKDPQLVSESQVLPAKKESLSTQDLLVSISKEKNLYEVSADNLLQHYQNTVSAHIDKLTGVILINGEKGSFIYPTARVNKTTVLCYIIAGTGITEEHLEITDLAKCSALSASNVTELKALIADYEGIKKRIQTHLANSLNSHPQAKNIAESYTSNLPLSILKDLSDNEAAISNLAVGMARYRP